MWDSSSGPVSHPDEIGVLMVKNGPVVVLSDNGAALVEGSTLVSLVQRYERQAYQLLE